MAKYSVERRLPGRATVILSVLALIGIGLAAVFVIQGQGVQLPTTAAAREPITIRVAITWVESPLEELIALADVVVRGEVLDPLPSRWNTPDGKLSLGTTIHNIPADKIIFTDTPVQVVEVLKGNHPEPTLLVRARGGRVEQDVVFSNDPELQPGHSVILFLRREDVQLGNVGPAHYRLVSGPQGVFEIVGQEVVTMYTQIRPSRLPLAELLAIITANR